MGRIIKAEINEAGEINLKDKKQAVKKIIPFPCLITALCRKVGVPEHDNDETARGDKGDLNIRSWNDTTSKTKGRRKFLSLGSSRQAADSGPEESEGNDEEDEDFAPQEEEFDLGDSEMTGGLGRSQFEQIMQAFADSKISQERMEGKIDTLSQQFYDYRQMQEYYRQVQEAEVEDVRADVAAVRNQLGYQTYQRRERRRMPPPSFGPQGFSAADYVPDDMTPADIERMRRGQSSRG